MKNFVTFSDLERISRGLQGRDQILARSKTLTGSSVFLSHSSKDEGHLPAIIAILEGAGASVYVDVKDESLPVTPSVETARILRAALKSCRKFIVFVSQNSSSSKWIPWELGLGDGQKGTSHVAIIPAAKDSWDQSWASQEYLGLYDRLIWGNFAGESDPQWLVYNHHDNTAVSLKRWLAS